MRPKPKVLNRFTRVLGPPQQQSIRTSRCLQSQLIQSQALPTSLLDPGARGRGKAQCSDRELRDGKKAIVICNRANDYNRLSIIRLLVVGIRGEVCKAREGDGRAVDARHEEAAEDDFVEIRVGTTWRYD